MSLLNGSIIMLDTGRCKDREKKLEFILQYNLQIRYEAVVQ